MQNRTYFIKELENLNKSRDLFSKRYPKIAPFLATDSDDMDVGYIVENLALLTSKLREEMDENIPVIAKSLVDILMPNYTNPLPAFCIQEFEINSNSTNNSLKIPKNTLLESEPILGVKCEFKTLHDLYLYKIKISNAFTSSRKDESSLSLEISTKDGLSLKDIDFKELSLYLGKDRYLSSTLLMWLNMHLKSVMVFSQKTNKYFKIPLNDIENIDERALTYDDFGFNAYSLLRELYFMSEKFKYIRLKNLEFLKEIDDDRFIIKFLFKKELPDDYIAKSSNFSLFSTPIINLFDISCEPIVNNKSSSYRIFPDRVKTHALEIISLKKVIAQTSFGGKKLLKNYNSFERFAFLEKDGDFYSTIDKFDSSTPYKEISFFSNSKHSETITIDALCCNQNLPNKLKKGDINNAVLFKEVATKNISTPTEIKRVKVDGKMLWNLVSILSFSYQTILDKRSFLVALSALNPYDDKEVSSKIINSIVDIKSKSIHRLDNGFIKKGTLCMFLIDEESFDSIGDVYMIGLVFSKFLSSFASINSFCELKIKCVKSGEILDFLPQNGNKSTM